jgi:hypothetical protein
LIFVGARVLAFVTAMLRTREVPTAPLVLYAVGAVPVSLRAFVPEAVLDLGLAVLAVGIAWLAIWLFNRSTRIATWTKVGTRTVNHDVAVWLPRTWTGPSRARPLSVQVPRHTAALLSARMKSNEVHE